ncbi:ribose transport protein RbsD [Scopulibacillus darangshiensis]|uniref:D-ribose pyranase n=1 Tax=Scopulibacillus darangshiensis TaxID=442528 RepID=A0A4R2NU21_9BACL|nr:D-ribose pyranase [Scopulibacillus darangshiensis]TCP24968.1 ribose transport protein RbsD [Scopulibacillus darangshiensis]
MKKTGILNSEIAGVLAHLGHTDTIVIADCGLPIPDHVTKIDVAIRKGYPNFVETLKEVAADMVIEKVTLAEEIQSANKQVAAHLTQFFEETPIEHLPHEELKANLQKAKAVIRTGEATPYANIILHAGVTF